MQRLIPALVLATATTLSAQLPPSSLKPGRPAAPAAPVPAAPAKPGFFGAPAPAQGEAEAEPAEAGGEGLTDFATAEPNTLSPEEAAQGWKLLFDGKNLVGMRGLKGANPLQSGWKVENGELRLPKDIRQTDKVTGGDLATVEQYLDFDFRFEWKATVSANSGVRYMVAAGFGQPPVGLEYQIIDDIHNPIGLKGGPIRRSGALDNVKPAGANAKLRMADPLNKKGEPWNEGRIVVKGNQVEHWLNGEKVLEFTLGPELRAIAEKNYKSGEPFGMRPHAAYGVKVKSPIVLLDQGTSLSFRNLKIRSLAPAAGAAPAVPGAAVPGVTPTPPAAPRPNPYLLPTNPGGVRR